MIQPLQDRVHASCVAFERRAVLILGPSGSGKSALALQLMALGCRLVADDQTILFARDGLLWAEAPDTIRSQIEARGVGILAAETVRRAQVVLAVDLEQEEADRMPPERTIELCGVAIPCLRRVAAPHFPAAVLQQLRTGRIA